MAEFEASTEVEYESDININFKDYSIKQRILMSISILLGREITFENVDCYYEGDVTVDIEPQDYH